MVLYSQALTAKALTSSWRQTFLWKPLNFVEWSVAEPVKAALVSHRLLVRICLQ